MSKHAPDCSCCGQPISSEPLDYACGLPEAAFEILMADKSEFARRVEATPDLCVIDKTRFFQRGLLPVPVEGSKQPFRYGIWFEVSLEDARRINKAWDDPKSYMALRVPAKIANKIFPYEEPALGVAVVLVAEDPNQRLAASAPSMPWLASLMVRGWSKTEHAEKARWFAKQFNSSG